MLPSKGYFNSLECPFYLSSDKCLRPYCHFKHPKRDLKNDGSVKLGINVSEGPEDENQISSCIPAPEKSSMTTPLVKHIPIAYIPTKPSAISVNTKKPKVPYIPYIQNDKAPRSNLIGPADYNPLTVMDSCEKTYSRYSYEKGHDSGDEIMENHKNLIETNQIAKFDDGSKSGIDEETDDFFDEPAFSPPISPADDDEIEEEMSEDFNQCDTPQLPEPPQEKTNESIIDKNKRDIKCKKKRKQSEMHISSDKEHKKIVSPDNANDKTEHKFRPKDHSNKSVSHKYSKTEESSVIPVKKIKNEENTNPVIIKKEPLNNGENTQSVKSEKKVCKYKSKRHSDDKKDDHSSTSKSSSESQNPSSDKKHSRSVEKAHSDHKKHSSSRSKKEDKEHVSSADRKKSSSESSNKPSSNDKKHSENKKNSSDKLNKKSSSSGKHSSVSKKHSSDSNKHSSDSNKHSSDSKKHSSSQNKKSKHEKTSNTSSRSKEHSNHRSSGKKSSEDNKKHRDDSKDHRKHSNTSSKHKTEHGKKEKSKSHLESEKRKSNKRRRSVSSSSASSTSEKKETILISDSSDSDEPKRKKSKDDSDVDINEIFGFSDDDDNVSDFENNEHHISESENENDIPNTFISRDNNVSSINRNLKKDLSNNHEKFQQIPPNNAEEQYKPAQTVSKVRIAHVPNVSSLLNAKNLISTGKTVSPTVEKLVKGMDVAKSKIPAKVVPINASASRPKPQVSVDVNSVIAVSIRQPGLNNIFDEFMKFVDYDEAYQRSIAEEAEICGIATNPQSYRNRIALCILKIRKSKGAVDVVTKEKITSNSKPDYTYGLTLYECFSKYLLQPEDFVLHGYPLELVGKPGCAYIDKNSYFRNKHVHSAEGPYRKCINCGKEYAVDEETGIPLTKDNCYYHWGKLIGTRQGKVYTCCKSEVGSDPCHIAVYHVTELKNEDCLSGFVKTRPYPSDADPNKAGIYAMDCEMCFTTQGRDIVRASLLAVDNESFYDILIKPKYPILDYCTRFSGITEEKLESVTTTLEDVQKFLLKIISDKTILVGHSLENDLKALKLMHYNVVDTSIMFPHKEGFPIKCALRNLCSRLLGTAIQTGENGHDSLEDARGSLQLVLHQVREDAKSRKPRVVKQLKSSK